MSDIPTNKCIHGIDPRSCALCEPATTEALEQEVTELREKLAHHPLEMCASRILAGAEGREQKTYGCHCKICRAEDLLREKLAAAERLVLSDRRFVDERLSHLVEQANHLDDARAAFVALQDARDAAIRERDEANKHVARLREYLNHIAIKTHGMCSDDCPDYDGEHPWHLSGVVKAIQEERDQALRDRDEWRVQHDNAVACWYEERDRLTAELRQIGALCGNEDPMTCIHAVRRLAAELQFYKDREQHFIKALGVSDGGQYRNDWDGAIQNALDEAKRLAAENARLVSALHVLWTYCMQHLGDWYMRADRRAIAEQVDAALKGDKP